MLNRAMLSSDSGMWGTPRDFYEWLNSQLAFTVDVAAVATNAKHPRFFSPKDNGLAQSWEGETVWLNPPYGRGIGQWVQKARDEAMRNRAIVACLLPARPDTDWWTTFVQSYDGKAGKLLRSYFDLRSRVLWLRWEGLLTGIYHHDQRLAFEGMDNDDGAPFPSAVVIHAATDRRPPLPPQWGEDEGRWDRRLLTGGWPR